MDDLIKKARGGRVVQSEFVEADRIDQLRIEAKQQDLEIDTFGGIPLAERQVVVLYPSHIPAVADPTKVLLIQFEGDLEALEDRIRGMLTPSLFGDLEAIDTGYLLVTLAKGKALLQQHGLQWREPLPEEMPKVRERSRSLVVPSLRVDVVGAKGFGTSRNYFAQGIKAGKVKLKGKVVTAKDDIGEGDVLVADGLGQLLLRKVLGQTKKGNVKVELEVTKSS